MKNRALCDWFKALLAIRLISQFNSHFRRVPQKLLSYRGFSSKTGVARGMASWATVAVQAPQLCPRSTRTRCTTRSDQESCLEKVAKKDWLSSKLLLMYVR